MSLGIVNEDGTLTEVAGNTVAAAVETTYEDYKNMEENGTLRTNVAYYIKDQNKVANHPVFDNIDESLDNSTNSYYTLTRDKYGAIVINGESTITTAVGAPYTSSGKTSSYNYNKFTSVKGDKYTIKYKMGDSFPSGDFKFVIKVWSGTSGQSLTPVNYIIKNFENTKSAVYELVIGDGDNEVNIPEGNKFVIETYLSLVGVCSDVKVCWWIEKCAVRDSGDFYWKKLQNENIYEEMCNKPVLTEPEQGGVSYTIKLPSANSQGILVVNGSYMGSSYYFSYYIASTTCEPINGNYYYKDADTIILKSSMLTVKKVNSTSISVTFSNGGGSGFFIGL